MLNSQKFSPIKNWFINYFTLYGIKKNFLGEITPTKVFRIPIQPETRQKCVLNVHTATTSCRQYKLTNDIINALGGPNNIETYHEIPNSRRIRLTLINPALIDNSLLEELDVRMFIRIGKRIVHIIP